MWIRDKEREGDSCDLIYLFFFLNYYFSKFGIIYLFCLNFINDKLSLACTFRNHLFFVVVSFFFAVKLIPIKQNKKSTPTRLELAIF